jgi:protein ImuB
MDRMACVDLPAFPLQLLLRQHPDWSGHPAAVVDRDKAQGILLWVNEAARAHRILPGMRYAAGLSLAHDLRAAVVDPTEIESRLEEVVQRLRFFTADVEVCREEPGVFWLDAGGLSLIHPSLPRWAALIQRDLTAAGFCATVVVGFSRFGTYAIAKSGADTTARSLAGTGHERGPIQQTSAGRGSPARGSVQQTGAGRGSRARGSVQQTGADYGSSTVVDRPEDEMARARDVAISRLGFDPSLREALARLGITTLGAFLELPAEGILERFGPAVYRLHRLARGELWSPLLPVPYEESFEGSLRFEDHPESGLDRLLAHVSGLLHSLRDRWAPRGRTLVSLLVGLVLEDGSRSAHRLQPAQPTNDLAIVLDLVRLRLESVSLAAAVAEILLEVETAPATVEQGELFPETPRRDLAAANRAFARLRADFGDATVLRAHLREGHLPEASFRWEPLRELTPPRPHARPERPLIRRFFPRPPLLSPPRRHEPDGWHISGIGDGPVEEIVGPYVVSGGWWMKDVHREYHYVRVGRSRWLWVYYDRCRRRWFLHGEVE